MATAPRFPARGRRCWSAVAIAAALISGEPSCQREPKHAKDLIIDDGSKKLQSLAAELKLALPSDSRVVGVEKEREGEEMVRAKVVMTRGGWNTFMASSPVKADRMDPGTGGFLGQDQGWWDPHAAPGLRTGQVQREPGRFLSVGFAAVPPDQIAVYIVQHGS